jgi:transposase
MPDTAPGLTTADIAARYRVGQSKVLTWIKSGQLRAINTAANLSARPRFVVTANALQEFERRRSATPPPKVKRRRPKNQETDFYPD